LNELLSLRTNAFCEYQLFSLQQIRNEKYIKAEISMHVESAEGRMEGRKKALVF
jgi:hypothetical protein